MIHPEFKRYKNNPVIQKLAAELRSVYFQGAKHVEAERKLNAAIEELIAPKLT